MAAARLMCDLGLGRGNPYFEAIEREWRELRRVYLLLITHIRVEDAVTHCNHAHTNRSDHVGMHACVLKRVR
jgi:hypothetical protein